MNKSKRLRFGVLAAVLFVLLVLCLVLDLSNFNTYGKSINLGFGWQTPNNPLCLGIHGNNQESSGWPFAHDHHNPAECAISSNTAAVVLNWSIYAASGLAGVFCLFKATTKESEAVHV